MLNETGEKSVVDQMVLKKSLYEAVLDGNKVAIENFIQTDVNVVDVQVEYYSKPVSLLCVAIMEKKTEISLLLLEEISKINADNGTEPPILDYAAIAEKINAVDNQGRSALHYSAIVGDEKIVSKLIELKADLNIKQESYNFTPLHFAIKNNHEEIVLKLIKAGADVTTRKGAKNYDPKENLFAAVMDSNRKFSAGMRLILVKKIVEAGLNVNEVLCVRSGFTPLHLAIKYGNINIAKFLIENGADVNKKNSLGDIPFKKNLVPNHSRVKI